MATRRRRERPKDGPFVVRPVRTLLLTVGAVGTFLVSLTVAARVTRETAAIHHIDTSDDIEMKDSSHPDISNRLDGGVQMRLDGGVSLEGPDAGPVALVDAGIDWDALLADAGPLVTAAEAPEDSPINAGVVVDAGPISYGPEVAPFEAAEVARAGADVVERCSREALRWDPSLGGAFDLRVSLPAAGTGDIVAVAADGLRSPVLGRCLERARPRDLPGGVGGITVPLIVQARASLSTSGVVTVADPQILGVTAPTP